MDNELESFLILKYGSVDVAFYLWLDDTTGLLFGDEFRPTFKKHAIRILPNLRTQIRQEFIDSADPNADRKILGLLGSH